MKNPHPTALDAPLTQKALEYRCSLPVERRNEAWEWGVESAANILIRGKVAEALDEFTAACLQYEAALRVAEFFGQASEAGEIHYGIGCCTSRLGHSSRAFEAYVAAARIFSTYGAPQGSPNRLSDALGEAGMLLVVSERGICSDISAAESLLDRGFDDAIRHASAVLFGEDPPTGAGLTVLNRKLVGIFVLAASASVSSLLSRAGRVLNKSIVAPFFDRYGMTVTPLLSLARLFAAIGEQKRPEWVGTPIAGCEVPALMAEASKSFSEGERPMLMRWLGAYLREHHGALWTTD